MPRRANPELTDRQKRVLDTIRVWIRERGLPPTIRELGKELQIKSLRGVTTHLDAIAKKGFIRRDSRARSISVVGLIEPFQKILHIPILGRIRAGEPILAEENIEDQLVVDSAWMGIPPSPEGPPHFALRVQGKSMIDGGILEGDFVIVRHQQVAQNGEIVVALLGDEATVKRFYSEGDNIRLQPDNASMEPIWVTPDQPCTILGKVVAVFRKFD